MCPPESSSFICGDGGGAAANSGSEGGPSPQRSPSPPSSPTTSKPRTVVAPPPLSLSKLRRNLDPDPSAAGLTSARLAQLSDRTSKARGAYATAGKEMSCILRGDVIPLSVHRQPDAPPPAPPPAPRPSRLHAGGKRRNPEDATRVSDPIVRDQMAPAAVSEQLPCSPAVGNHAKPQARERRHSGGSKNDSIQVRASLLDKQDVAAAAVAPPEAPHSLRHFADTRGENRWIGRPKALKAPPSTLLLTQFNMAKDRPTIETPHSADARERATAAAKQRTNDLTRVGLTFERSDWRSGKDFQSTNEVFAPPIDNLEHDLGYRYRWQKSVRAAKPHRFVSNIENDGGHVTVREDAQRCDRLPEIRNRAPPHANEDGPFEKEPEELGHRHPGIAMYDHLNRILSPRKVDSFVDRKPSRRAVLPNFVSTPTESLPSSRKHVPPTRPTGAAKDVLNHGLLDRSAPPPSSGLSLRRAAPSHSTMGDVLQMRPTEAAASPHVFLRAPWGGDALPQECAGVLGLPSARRRFAHAEPVMKGSIVTGKVDRPVKPACEGHLNRLSSLGVQQCIDVNSREEISRQQFQNFAITRENTRPSWHPPVLKRRVPLRRKQPSVSRVME